ncbi:hypothetical protein [Spiroplasma endosymbiont of Virgichneumon dumeticola]|uniref:hypothetical protein n=1 Tax=Spiroplasma endosymbiont of Virgichneumon dumeticola TaxID=3139323 RepID=UPI0035C915D2
MIKELWTDISLENYNKWYPLTGIINDTPQQYVNTWPNANEWFTTFAIRAQNDINAYLNFILYKFHFDSFKDKLIQETLRDMVYVMIEHWVFNRTPIEFNVDANIQFNNGTQFSASSIPTINVWDLAPSRMKILAQLTKLKELLMSYDEQEIDVDKIDLEAFYTRNQVDELIENEKEQRISGDKDNHDFILTKQIKLYDDVVSEKEHEVFRGAVTKLVNKSYVATEYDPETETMILNWPSEIGTLPPEALQNNPQEGDFTHAPTADFSAKQQKRITSNENNIKLANTEIENIKNNWFNIETSPLWKRIDEQIPIPNDDINKWFIVFWDYGFQNYDDLYLVKKTSKFQFVKNQNISPTDVILDKLILKDNVIITLLLNLKTNIIYFNSNSNNYGANIDKIYKYQGIGKPTELIAETNNNDNYYNKQETNELLDKKQNISDENLQTKNKTIVSAINEVKNVNDTQDLHISQIKTEVTNVQGVLVLKQDKLIAGTNITIDKETNTISATGGKTDLTDYYKKEETNKLLDKKQDKIFNNKDDKDSTTRLVNDVINVGNRTLIYKNKSGPSVTDDNDIPNKKYVDEKIKSLNVIKWKNVGTKESNIKINYDFKVNTLYRVGYCWKNVEKSPIIYMQFLWQGEGAVLASFFKGISGKRITEAYVDLVVISNAIAMDRFNDDEGKIYSLEEEIKENTYKITSNTLDITSPSIINIDKPIKINSKSLETNEIEDNCWDIELKDNPTPNPNPNPSIPKWKEVGTRITKNQINYKFFSGKKYRVTYIWDGDTQPIAYSISKEFNKLRTSPHMYLWRKQWNWMSSIILFKLKNNVLHI